jgi:hypothetical protein
MRPTEVNGIWIDFNEIKIIKLMWATYMVFQHEVL